MRRLYYNDDEFSKVFSDKLKDYSVAPPAGNWSAIRSKLNQRSIKRYALLKWSGGVIGSLILLGALIHYTTHDNENYYLAQKAMRNQQEAYSAPANQTNSIKVESSAIASHKQSVLTVPQVKSGAPSSIKPNIAQAIYDINKAIARIENVVAPSEPVDEIKFVSMEPLEGMDKSYISSQPIISPALALNNDADATINSPISVSGNTVNNENTVIKVPLVTRDCSNTNLKLYGGITANPQYTYLLSGTVIDDPNLHYRFSPGYSFGVLVGYNILPKLALEVNGVISNENQNYSSSEQTSKLLNEPIQTENEWIHLNYIRVPVLLKYKFATSGSKCVCDESLNIVGGLQYGRFYSGSAYDGTAIYSLNNGYVDKNDLQLVAGVEREKALTKYIVLNMGLRFAYSSTEIADNQSLRINELYKPHNLNSAITLSLSYR